MEITKRFTEGIGKWRLEGELILAYLVWGLGIALYFPVTDLINRYDAAEAGIVIYPLVINLPLAVHYDRALGFSASIETRQRFVGSSLFHPVLVYGGFLLLLVIAGISAVGIWGPPLSEIASLQTIVAFFLLLIYFPVIIFAALLLKWGRWGVYNVFRILRWILTFWKGRVADESAEEPEMDRSPQSGGATDKTGSTAYEGGKAEPDLTHEQHIRFVSLLGLVLLPIGAGWFTGRPQFGVSVASLLLAVYEIAYKDKSMPD